MREVVQEWVERDPLGYAFLMDFYQRGARVAHHSPQGLVLKNDGVDITFAAGTDVDCPESRKSKLVLLSETAAMEFLVAQGCYDEVMDCTQAIYQSKEPVEIPAGNFTLRPLTMEDLPFLLENYHNPGAFESHLRGRIDEGMLGGEIDGELAGFAGVHEEGTVGMLEVLPQFRRRGLAEVLEAAVINQQLSRGRLPYCHVRTGNDASIALQKKLGFTFDTRTLYWLG